VFVDNADAVAVTTKGPTGKIDGTLFRLLNRKIRDCRSTITAKLAKDRDTLVAFRTSSRRQLTMAFRTFHRPLSASNSRHGALAPRSFKDGSMVFLGFSGDGRLKQGLQVFLAAAVSKRTPDIYLVIREQAGPESAIGGQPQAIAGRTEMMTHGGDKADFTGRRREAISPGRPVFG
jgi:hypothetical protein